MSLKQTVAEAFYPLLRCQPAVTLFGKNRDTGQNESLQDLHPVMSDSWYTHTHTHKGHVGCWRMSVLNKLIFFVYNVASLVELFYHGSSLFDDYLILKKFKNFEFLHHLSGFFQLLPPTRHESDRLCYQLAKSVIVDGLFHYSWKLLIYAFRKKEILLLLVIIYCHHSCGKNLDQFEVE